MELLRALAALAEPPSPALDRVADALGIGPLAEPADYTELFLLELPPYASVYLGAEGMLGGDARDRVAGFWRALDLQPPPEPDHITTLLAFYAHLVDQERDASTDRSTTAARQARRSFFWEHVASWLPVWLTAVEDRAPPFYRRWGSLLQDVIAQEARELGPQERLSLHLREAPPLADPREAGGAAFIAALLTPVRSGLVIVRSDLRLAATELDVGVRVADRSLALTSLVAEKSSAALDWLADRADWWTTRHAARTAFGPVSEFWTARARATAALLRQLQHD